MIDSIMGWFSAVPLQESSMKRKFGGDKALQSTGDKDAMNRGKGVMLTDEDEDHIILEMEERWDSEFRMGPVGPCMMRDRWGVEKTPMASAREKEVRPDEIHVSLENDQMGSVSSKRSRNEASSRLCE
ncbi:hypothetical protein YC2023_118554 [Brassica napus]